MALCNATARALLLTRRFPRSHLSSKCFLVPICATQSLSRFPGPAQAFRRHDARFWFWTSVSGHQDRDFQHLPLRTGQTVPETCSDASPLSRRQLDELYSGKFPTDHPSEVIKIPLSIGDYHRIHEAFDARNSSVRVLFNAQLSTTSVLMSTPVHQTLISKVSKSLLAQLPFPNFDAVGSCEVMGSQTKLNLFPLEPDMQLLYQESESSRSVPVLTLQVSFSQTYDDLLLVTRRTIEETRKVQATILINVKESPSYDNPLRGTTKATYRNRDTGKNESIGTIVERMQLRAQDDELRSEIRREIPDDLQSPLRFRGVRWVGRLHMELEIWARDSETGKATRRVDPIVIYGEGAQEDAKLDFRLDEFVPSGNAQYRRNLRLDWKQWWNQLEHAREGLVISRARKAVEKFAKRKQPKSRKKSSSGGSKGSNK